MPLKLKAGGRLVGEFVLIVVGVLAALALEAWFDQRADAALAREYTARLRAELELDLGVLSGRAAFFEDVAGFAETTLRWLDDGTLSDREAVVAAFHAAEVAPFQPTATTYNDLQNTGNVRLLDDLDVRLALASYHARVAQRQNGWTLPEGYREIARGAISPRIQALIRSRCPSAVQGEPTGFPPCTLRELSDAEFRNSARRLRASEEVRTRLTYLLSELDVAIRLYRYQAREAEALLDRLYVPERQAENAGGVP